MTTDPKRRIDCFKSGPPPPAPAAPDLSTVRNQDFLYRHLFPTPIPEPPRVVSSKPLVSDVSITSEADVRIRPKVRYKQTKVKVAPPPVIASTKPRPAPLTTTIYPTEDELDKLRRKYGILPARADAGYASSEDESIVSVEAELPPKSVRSSSRTSTVTSSKSKSSRSSSTSTKPVPNQQQEETRLRTRLHEVQTELEAKLQHLQLTLSPDKPPTKTALASSSNPADYSSSSGVSSDSSSKTATTTTSGSCVNCTSSTRTKAPSEERLCLETSQRSATTTSTTTSTDQTADQVMTYIRKQDQQLQTISQQIAELLRIQRATQNGATGSREQQKALEPGVSPTKRSIETMTSFLANCTNYQQLPPKGAQTKPKELAPSVQPTLRPSSKTRKVPATIHVPSGSDYLDSSIERARRELQQSLQQSSSDDDEQPLPGVRHQESRGSASPPGQTADMYTNMISTINSILVRNGSFETPSSESDLIYNHHQRREEEDSRGSGNRSSCSEPDYTRFTSRRPAAASSPKIHQRTTLTKQTLRQTAIASSTDSPRTVRRRRFLHSEQSLYIEKLASKYEVCEEEEEFEEDQGEISAQSELLKRYTLDREYDAKVYCLSDQNTSIATREYLDKYGLTYSPPTSGKAEYQQQKQQAKTSKGSRSKPPGPPSRGKSTATRALHSLEEEEEDGVPERHLKAKQSTVNRPVRLPAKIREVKSRTRGGPGPCEDYSRILDLEAIKNLPKLT